MQTTHYIYYPKTEQNDANRLLKRLLQDGFNARVAFLDYEEGQWLVIIDVIVVDNETGDLIEEAIVNLANEYGGEYDGSETTVEE